MDYGVAWLSSILLAQYFQSQVSKLLQVTRCATNSHVVHLCL